MHARPPLSVLAHVTKITALVILGVVLFFETVPRFVPLPGLSLDELNPPQLRSGSRRRAQPHPYLSYALRPGWTSAEDAMEQVSHNPLGFRGPEPQLPKPAGIFRILCVGGSSTYGSGPTKDKNTYPAVLQELLHERGATAVETVNLGVKGWTTTESLINLSLRGMELEPDLVVVYQATNDALATMWPEPNWDQTHFRTTWTEFQRSGFELALEHSRVYLMLREYLTDYSDSLLNQDHYTIRNQTSDYSEPDIDREVPERGVLTYLRNLRQMVALTRAYGAQIAFVRQAFHPGEGTGPNPNSGAVRKRVMGRLLEAQEALGEELGVPVIDVATELEAKAREQLESGGEQRVFTNNVHLTNGGARELAKVLSRELIRLQLVPRS